MRSLGRRLSIFDLARASQCLEDILFYLHLHMSPVGIDYERYERGSALRNNTRGYSPPAVLEVKDLTKYGIFVLGGFSHRAASSVSPYIFIFIFIITKALS